MENSKFHSRISTTGKKVISLSFLLVFLVISSVLILVSCEKVLLSDNEADGGDSNGNLHVYVTQIEQTPFPNFTRATEAASAVCTRLNFAIYDEGGSRLKQVNQTSGQSGFGSCSFQLEEGTYQLVVVGHSAGANPTMTNPAKIQFTNSTGYTDTFLYSEEVVVGEEQVDKGVMLSRIVSLCRFTVTDDIPAGVKTMRFYYTGGSGAFNAVTGLGSVASKQTVTFDVTADQTQYDLYTFLHEESENIALTVTALDASGNTLYERKFDVPMQQNYITWLSGPLFNSTGSSSSTTIPGVTINTTWAGEHHLTF